MDMFRLHDPYTDAFHSARVNVPRIFDRHFGVGSVKAANVLMIEALPASDKHFPERPVGLCHSWLMVVGFWFLGSLDHFRGSH